MFQTSQQYVGALGVALFTTMFFGIVGDSEDGEAHLDALRWCMVPLLVAGAALVGAGVWLHRRGYFGAPQRRVTARV
jgi:hypothetical protein